LLLFLFIVGCVAGVVGLVALFAKKPAGLIGILVFLGLWAMTSFTTVPTRAVGVVTSFNKPTGETYTAGIHNKAPWKSVTDMSLANQTEPYEFIVQAAGGAQVGLEIKPRWHMTQQAAPELFQDYKDFDGVIHNLFYIELVDASQELFSTYNPLTAYDVKTSLPIKSKEQYSAELKAELEKRLSGKIVFERVAITAIAPDARSQAKLNQQLEEFGKGKVLDQALVNAGKQQAITAKNAEVDKETRCMEIAEKNGTDPGTCRNGASLIVTGNK
jgi:SPFH domain/Band 7 family protein